MYNEGSVVAFVSIGYIIETFLVTSFYSSSCSLVLAAVNSRQEGLFFLDSAAGQEALLTMSRSPHPGRQDDSHRGILS